MVHWVIWGELHSSWSRIRVEHHVPLVNAVLGNPHSSIEHHSTTIYGFNANGMRPMGKIKLKYQIRGQRSEMTCYVIDADTSYNLLLRRPWIHRNSFVPSTLHQVMKYVDREGKVWTLIAKRHPFKRVENYFTDSLLYQDSPKIDDNP